MRQLELHGIRDGLVVVGEHDQARLPSLSWHVEAHFEHAPVAVTEDGARAGEQVAAIHGGHDWMDIRRKSPDPSEIGRDPVEPFYAGATDVPRSTRVPGPPSATAARAVTSWYRTSTCTIASVSERCSAVPTVNSPSRSVRR